MPVTHRVMGRELEEIWGEDGRCKEPQEDEAAHGCVLHIQVIWPDRDQVTRSADPLGPVSAGAGGPELAGVLGERAHLSQGST